MASLNISDIRSQFPVLNQQVNGKELVYLDNAATTHNPLSVLNASSGYYKKYNSNIHRGTHKLARLATEAYESARTNIADFIGANTTEEVIFTAGTTAGINLIAHSLALSGEIQKKHNIIISTLEHHSNIVPWQQLCQRVGCQLKVIPITDNGELDLTAYKKLVDSNTKMVAVAHVSNALGTINPVKKITTIAKSVGAYVLLDAAQSAPHCSLNAQEIGCDFIAFSGHKIYAPTGIGILWGKKHILDTLPPWQGGGEMIKEVTFETTTYNDLPFKFEAGTPNIEGAIALSAAIDWIKQFGIENIAAHEAKLLSYTSQQMLELPNIKILGQAPQKAGVISFIIEGVHHYDLGTLMDQMGVATRTGHHCCQPLMNRFGISGTTRASFAIYNNTNDCDSFIQALKKSISMLA